MMIVLEYGIEKVNFEKQKEELKEFIEQPVVSTELDTFATSGKMSDFLSGGLVGVLSGHKVTGEELNSFVTKLQRCFVEINERNRKVIKGFGQIYETFEALDKGYIQGILIGVKSAEKASQEAKNAQKDVDDTIKALQGTINKLKEFKDEVGRYSHLKDIDKIWNDILQLDRNLKIISKKIEEQETTLNKRIAELNQFRTKIEKQAHINDIDDIWIDIKSSNLKVEEISTNLKRLSNDLKTKTDELLAFKDKLEKSEHIKDVDLIWEKVEEFPKDISRLSKDFGEIVRTIEKDIETFTKFIGSQEHFSDVDKIWEMLQEVQKKTQDFSVDLEEYKESQHKVDEKIFELTSFFVKLQSLQHIGDVDDEWEYSHDMAKKLDRTENRISDTEYKVREYEEKLAHCEIENLQLKNRMNRVYIIASSALGVSIIQLILLFVGIL